MNIFTKLLLLLAIVAVVPLGVTAIIMTRNANQLELTLTEQVAATGEQVSQKSADALRTQVEQSLLKIVQDKAAYLESYFEDIRRAVLLETSLIQQFNAYDAPPRHPFPLYTDVDVNVRRDDDPNFKRWIYRSAPYVMHFVVQGVERESVAPMLDKLRQLGPFFAQTFQTVRGCGTVYMGHRDGFMLGYPGGSRVNAAYDPRQRVWYKQAEAADTLIWTKVYVDRGESDLIITCANPIHDHDGSMLGVAAIDLSLKQLLPELFALGELPVSQAMLIDEDGLVRVSADYVKGRAQFDRSMVLESKHVNAFGDEGLRQVYDSAVTGKRSGIEIVGREGEQFLYSFASVEFRARLTSPSAAGPEENTQKWRYVIKTPLGPVLKPAHEIRAEIGATTGAMSKVMQSEVERLGVIIATICAAAIAISLVVSYIAAHNATRPLVQMESVADRIAVGDLNQQVHVRGSDEIARLGQAINEMIKGLREREFIKGTFKRYVTASIVEELLKDPTKLKLGGEKKELTIFFSDLSGFTSIAEKLPPETLVQLLNEYLGTMTDALLAQEGTLDKYIGDAIVAFWGAPLAREDDAVRACRTAVEQLNKLRVLWSNWESRGLPKLDVRIGIQTGPVIVGNIGCDTQMNYTVIGDTANFSSRLEGANKAYGTRILIGEATRKAAGDAIEVREIDRISVVGRSFAARVFELLGMKGDVSAERMAGYRAFEAALELYRRQRWDEAEAAFRGVIAALGADKPSEVFLKRVAMLREEPVKVDWDGVWVLTEK